MMKTRDRILQCSLEMFSQYGHVKVSTVEIANALEISPGNLYYHFNGKEQLLTELFYEYEAAINKLMSFYEEDVQAFEDYWAYLNVYVGLIQQYSFFYRDMKVIFDENKLLKRRFMRLVHNHHSFFLKMLTSLNERSEIKMTEAQQSSMADTICLIATNSLDTQLAEEDYDLKAITQRIVLRIIMLIEPYFSNESKEKYLHEVELNPVETTSLFS